MFGYNIFQIINEEHDFVLEFTARESLRLTNFKSRENVFCADYNKSQNPHLVNIIPHEV